MNGNTRDGVIHFPNIRTSTLWVRCTMKKPFIRWAAFPGTQFVFQYRRYCGVNANDAERRGYGDVQLFSAETVKMFTTSSRKMPLLASAGA